MKQAPIRESVVSSAIDATWRSALPGEVPHRVLTAGRAAAMAALLLGSWGCSTWRPAVTSPGSGSRVRVSYEPPREVVARYTSGDSLRIAGVREITGTVTRAVPDTLFVRLVEGPTSLSTARDVPGPGPIPRDAIVAVPQEAGVAISAYRLNKKANLVALGVVAALAGVLALMLATAEWDYR